MVAALINVTESLGYPLLFLLVMVESLGIPLPGETALVVAGLAASQGKLSIELVIAVAAVAAITGDNIGFWIGSRGGRALLERPGRFERERHWTLENGDRFFARHGAKAVFLGRWVTLLRTWASWLAGASTMTWRTFLVWNAAGAVAWSTSIALAAYFGGRGAQQLILRTGVYGAVALGVGVVVAITMLRARRRRSS